MIVCGPFSSSAIIRVCSFIVESLPLWKNFQVVDKAKYLGYIIGPGASQLDNFRAPTEKFWKRILSISACPFSARASAIAARRDAIPVLTYIGQLVEPPIELSKLQLAYNSKV